MIIVASWVWQLSIWHLPSNSYQVPCLSHVVCEYFAYHHTTGLSSALLTSTVLMALVSVPEPSHGSKSCTASFLASHIIPLLPAYFFLCSPLGWSLNISTFLTAAIILPGLYKPSWHWLAFLGDIAKMLNSVSRNIPKSMNSSLSGLIFSSTWSSILKSVLGICP